MPYIGNTIRAADDYRLIDDISSGFNGSETSFALQVAGSAPVPFPKSPQQVLISVNGVIQEPDPTGSSGFNLVGTNIVFSSAPTNGHAFFGIIYATADYLNAGGNFPAGSLGAPSITFIGDENTGLFRKSGGSVGFVSDATEIANFDSNGITISSGNIIIPDSIIHNGDSNTKIRFPAADTISAETAGSEALRITSTGRLGINETNPGYKLVVGGDIGVGFTTPNDAARQLNFNVNRGSAGDTLANINWQWNSKFVAQIRGIAGSDTTNKDDAHLAFFTSAANNLVERMRISRAGVVNIGAGTNESGLTPLLHLHKAASAATAYLHITNTDSGITNNDGFVLGFNGSNDALVFNKENTPLRFATNGSERMRITNGGVVSIGATSPVTSATNLAVENSGENNVYFVGNTSSSGARLILQNKNTTANSFTGVLGADAGGQTTADIKFYSADNDNNEGYLTLETRPSGGIPTERMRIDSAGKVGIGTTSPGSSHSLASNLVINSSADTGMTIKSGSTSDGRIFFADGTSGSAESEGQVRYDHNTDKMHFACSDADVMTLDGPARCGIGTTSPTNNLEVIAASGDPIIKLSGPGHAQLILISTSNSDHCGVNFGDSDNAAIGRVQYTNSTNHMIFNTNATEKMRIQSDGMIGIGTTGPKAGLHVATENTTYGIAAVFGANGFVDNANYHYTDSTITLLGQDVDGNNKGAGVEFTARNTGNSNWSHGSLNMARDGDFNWRVGGSGTTQGTNRMRLLTDGDIFLAGADGADRMFQGNTKGFVYDHDGGGAHPFIGVQHSSKTTGAAAYISFQSQTSERGKIAESNSGNNVTYNTSSDYRLKQDEVQISDGITRLKQLKPYQFKWKDNLEYGYVDGFFAHEVGDVIKGSATGVKDEVVTQEGLDNGTYNKNRSVGDMVAQGLDYSRLTPLLTAALQEAVAKIETLETEVAALKAA